MGAPDWVDVWILLKMVIFYQRVYFFGGALILPWNNPQRRKPSPLPDVTVKVGGVVRPGSSQGQRLGGPVSLTRVYRERVGEGKHRVFFLRRGKCHPKIFRVKFLGDDFFGWIDFGRLCSCDFFRGQQRAGVAVFSSWEICDFVIFQGTGLFFNISDEAEALQNPNEDCSNITLKSTLRSYEVGFHGFSRLVNYYLTFAQKIAQMLRKVNGELG